MVQTTSLGEQHALTLALYDVVQRLRRTARGDDAHDRSTLALLGHLVEVGPVRVTDLAHHACLDTSTVSRHLKALEEAGYVERSADPDDRRVARMQVSADGYQLLHHALDARARVLADVTAGWNERDRTTLTRLLRRLADDLETS